MISHPSLLKAALTADALNLGPHWVYNQAKLTRKFAEGIAALTAPLTNYHPGKSAGDFTHYGDNLALMLRTHAITDQWNHDLFSQAWESFWKQTESFQDQATKTTLAHLENPQENPPSISNDTSGPGMALALLAFLDLTDEAAAIRTIRQHTAFTHGDEETVDTSEFFTRVALHTLKGQSIPDAIEQAAQADYATLDAAAYLTRAKAALASDNHLKVAADFGLTCHNPEAFPLTLYYLLRNPTDLSTAINENALAGGDNAARAIIIAILLVATQGWDNAFDSHWENLTQHRKLVPLLASDPQAQRKTLTFVNEDGKTLHATLELPANKPRAYAIFAHCFTCGQSSRGARNITASLANKGIATLRFDFAGLGKSEGDFSATSFLTNTQDLVAAANHLEKNYAAPSLLIGHSLGGAAVLATAHRLPSVTAIATVGAPADPTHVQHLFADHLDEINANGSAEIKLAGRPFKIGKRFLDDVKDHCQACHISDLKRDLLILHSPTDDIVGIENAAEIYTAAKHPKSFISLTNADHLLLKPGAAEQAAEFIAAWAKRTISQKTV
jgi:fermentation-respiration switch protein FrsA (DUF1100 family)/ADP-ribosylglycohydrolase